ncbi:MAG: ATPase domain-containing protein [Methanomassiliicoccales archaeon]
MKKKYECPRCGAGIKPGDIQCDRCGEILKPVESKKDTPSLSVTVEKVLSEEEVSVAFGQSEYLTISRQKQLLVQREAEITKKEKELKEKERKLLETIEALERDNQALEEAMKRCKEFETELRAREEALLSRESELETLAMKLEKQMRELEISAGSGRKIKLTDEEFERLLALKEDYEKALNEGYARLRKQIEEELKERFEKLIQLQKQIEAVDISHRIIPETQDGKVRDREEKISIEPAETLDLSSIIEELKREADLQTKTIVGKEPIDMRIRTHIERLDVAMGGGIPAGNVILINGCAGTMKSTLAYAILYNSAIHEGLNSMYFSLEQSRESLLNQMEKMGMPKEKSGNKVLVVDMIDLRKRMVKERGDWRNILMRYVGNIKKEWDFKIFVLDSIESFKSLTDYQLSRQDLKDLFDWFRSLNMTVLLISEKPLEVLLDNAESEAYLADGIIEMRMKEIDDVRVQRWLRVLKMRGTEIDPRYFSFTHDGSRFNLTVPIVE